MIKNNIPTIYYDSIYNFCKAFEKSDEEIIKCTPQAISTCFIYIYLCIFPFLKKN